MKNILKLTVILLILTSSFTCKKTEPETDGIVPYAPCSCEDKEQASLIFSPGEALLFKDSIPNDMAFQILSWIVFDSKTDTAILTIGGKGAIEHICEICNYPDFAKAWDIPINGCKIYFEGIAYAPCIPKGGIATVSYYDYILTVLKRK
jgi:hypothetical protein